MVQKLWHCFESLPLAALQLLIVGYSLSGLWPAGAQTGQPSPLSTFLTQYPEGNSSVLAARQQLWRLGERTWAGYRVVGDPEEGDQSIAEEASRSFEASCSDIGGHIVLFDYPSEIVVHLAKAKGIVLNPTNAPIICAEAKEQPTGAFFAYNFWDVSGDRYAALFVMTPEATREMLAIYRRAKATELRVQTDMAEKRAADEARRADWRAKLLVGSETHCGPVIELRGPMVQIVHGRRADWVRRDRLYPMQDAMPCREFVEL